MSGSTVRPVVAIPVGEIVVPPQRLRTLKEDQAEAIGKSIAAHGQFDPIAVTQLPGRSDHILVDGWHRLEGCKMAGLPTIEARVIGTSKAQRIRHEAISGMARATHDVFDRAAAIDALARLARQEDGLPEEGDLRRFNGTPARAIMAIDQAAEDDFLAIRKSMRWDLRLAEALGCSDDTIRILRRVHLRIPEEIKDRIRHAGASEELTSLNRLTRHSEAEMLKAVVFLEDGSAGSLSAAIAMLEEPTEPASPVLKQQNAALRKADGWSARQRQDFIQRWNSLYLPDGRRRSADKG